MAQKHHSTEAAIEAFRRGFTPIPVRTKSKRPLQSNWTHTRYEDEKTLADAFDAAREDGAENIGLMLGRGNLVDVDLDHPLAMRLRDYFLPPSPMETGRPGRPRSHRWYLVDGEIPSTRQYKMPDKSMVIELRSTGGQTLIPPSIWVDKANPRYEEPYQWEGEPWGGDEGPAVIPTRVLQMQVALLALAAVLVENWPGKGSRHEAFLCLAGGLLRYGDGVHEFWEHNVETLIGALADVTHDEDADARVAESVRTTVHRLRTGSGHVAGFGKLAEIIGDEHADMVRRMAREVESLAGFVPEPTRTLDAPSTAAVVDDDSDDDAIATGSNNPLEDRISSWAALDLEPYLSGQVTMPEPSILRRTDGQGMFYPGRVNMLYGKSESAKSWIAMHACIQEMSVGERVVYLDFEDEPVATLARMRALGAGDDDIKNQFRYVHPEGPLAAMQRYQHGPKVTEDGLLSESVFWQMLESFDPTLIVADGLTVLYGLHGHDTNHATATDVITSWMKSLTRKGRTSVIVIDHTGKTGGKGSGPIGAHHKTAMVMGTSLRVDVVQRPMPGERGHVRLAVFKDRIGTVRAAASRDDEQIGAEVYVDSTTPGEVWIDVQPPLATPPVSVSVTSAAVARQDDMNTIVETMELDPTVGYRTADIAAATGLAAIRVSKLLRDLVNDGRVVKVGETKATRYWAPDPVTGEIHADD